MHVRITRLLTSYFLRGVKARRAIWGPLTKRKKSYAKERCLLAEQNAKASHVERSTSITKRLVFQYPFCRKASCNRVLERFLSSNDPWKA